MQINDNGQALYDHLQQQAELNAQYNQLHYQPWRWLSAALLIIAALVLVYGLSGWLFNDSAAAANNTLHSLSIPLTFIFIALGYIHRELERVHQRVHLLKQLIEHNNQLAGLQQAASQQHKQPASNKDSA